MLIAVSLVEKHASNDNMTASKGKHKNVCQNDNVMKENA